MMENPIKMDDLGHMVIYEIYIPTEGKKKKKQMVGAGTP